VQLYQPLPHPLRDEYAVIVSNQSPANRRYQCSDGAIDVAVANADQWRALAVCLGRPELAYEGSWEIIHTAEPDGPLSRVLEEHFQAEPAALWARRLVARGVPCTVVPPQ
jgi:crotonobetainyl-CoA:carnitine CoA-transferase CaiB-like acyl-CoA transferase